MYITEATRLDGSPFGEVLEVEIEDDMLQAAPVRQRESRAIIKAAAEIRCHGSNVQHIESMLLRISGPDMPMTPSLWGLVCVYLLGNKRERKKTE